MIDARHWTRPAPSEIGDMIHGLRDGRTLKETAAEIGARLDRSRRRVYYWMNPQPGREIDYCEWIALRALVSERKP